MLRPSACVPCEKGCDSSHFVPIADFEKVDQGADGDHALDEGDHFR